MLTERTWSSCLWTGKGAGAEEPGGGGKPEEQIRIPRFLVALLFRALFPTQLRRDSGWQPLRAAEEVCPEWQPPALLCGGLLLARMGAGRAVP